MGYEILYKYHERTDDGEYNKDETKELKRRLGEPFEEIPLEKLASSIMSQLARRDIWVIKVEIEEYKKAKISFRETKGGLVIKNKKFSLDNDSNIVVQEEEIPALPAPVPVPQAIAQVPITKRVIKMVTLDEAGIIQGPSGERIPVMLAVKRAGLQLFSNKKYPVYQEMDDPRDKRVDKFGNPTLDRKRVYVMCDEMKREVTVSQDYFVSANIRLEGGIEFNRDQPVDTGPGLMYENMIPDVVPDLRRK